MAGTAAATTSFPLFSILGIVFIVLKLTGYIAWSWWWVLAPFWAPVAVFLSIVLIVAIAIGLAANLK